MGGEEARSLEYTPSWIVAVVCSVIVGISLVAERGLHHLGKFLKKDKKNHALFEALQKLKEELMLLGFISLLLTVFQGLISRICIPLHLADFMLPCKFQPSEKKHYHYFQQTLTHGRRLLAETESAPDHCAHKGKVPLLSLEGLHQLHIFIFVLAIVHVIFCATTMVLGGARIRQWKHWEDSAKKETMARTDHTNRHGKQFHEFMQRTMGYWRKSSVVSWMMAFFKQFYGSVTYSDYCALRSGFIRAHCPSRPGFNFHDYMLRTLEIDFKKIVGISWFLWLFVVVFLLLNLEGWHTYFWLSFLPLILLLLVGAKLEHIITRLAEDAAESRPRDQEAQQVKPSDDHFWFKKPKLVLYLIHFILFQNSFEIAFFFWIMFTYGFRSCIMEKLGYIIPRLIIGVIVQVLCSYSTLPLYALVSQMGSMFKESMFNEHVLGLIREWMDSSERGSTLESSERGSTHLLQKTTIRDDLVSEEAIKEVTMASSMVELSSSSDRSIAYAEFS